MCVGSCYGEILGNVANGGCKRDWGRCDWLGGEGVKRRFGREVGR